MGVGYLEHHPKRLLVYSKSQHFYDWQHMHRFSPSKKIWVPKDKEIVENSTTNLDAMNVSFSNLCIMEKPTLITYEFSSISIPCSYWNIQERCLYHFYDQTCLGSSSLLI